MNPFQTAGGWVCQWCGEHIPLGMNHACSPQRYEHAPIGCICPPGANKDCERLDCPRKAVTITAAGVTTKGREA